MKFTNLWTAQKSTPLICNSGELTSLLTLCPSSLWQNEFWFWQPHLLWEITRLKISLDFCSCVLLISLFPGKIFFLMIMLYMQIEMEGWLWMHACFSNYAGYECIRVLLILLKESYTLAGYECSPTLIQSETSICSLWALLRAVNWAAVLKIELFAPGKRPTVYHQVYCKVTQKWIHHNCQLKSDPNVHLNLFIFVFQNQNCLPVSPSHSNNTPSEVHEPILSISQRGEKYFQITETFWRQN